MAKPACPRLSGMGAAGAGGVGAGAARPARLAAELFPETVDPLGSLRWCLASLRKALNCSECLTGDPIEANFPAGIEVDVLQLEHDDFDIEQAGRLLGGIEPTVQPGILDLAAGRARAHRRACRSPDPAGNDARHIRRGLRSRHPPRRTRRPRRLLQRKRPCAPGEEPGAGRTL